jgi:hypothetical protein
MTGFYLERVSSTCSPRRVSGHDFSRAERSRKDKGVLTPEGLCPDAAAIYETRFSELVSDEFFRSP